MKTNILNPRFVFITSAIFIVAASRLFPHIPNFTPLAAMALFGGAYLSNKRMAFIVPLIALFVSDVAMQLLFGWGFHNTMIYVYLGFALTTMIGMLIRKNISVKSIAVGSVASSVVFFILTNFGYWAANGFFMGAAGLNISYIEAIPFFATSLFGDLFFNAVLFGSFYLAQTKYPVLVTSK